MESNVYRKHQKYLSKKINCKIMQISPQEYRNLMGRTIRVFGLFFNRASTGSAELFKFNVVLQKEFIICLMRIDNLCKRYASQAFVSRTYTFGFSVVICIKGCAQCSDGRPLTILFVSLLACIVDIFCGYLINKSSQFVRSDATWPAPYRATLLPM